MKCPYCNEFKDNSRVRGSSVKEQLRRHIEVNHPHPNLTKLANIGYGSSEALKRL